MRRGRRPTGTGLVENLKASALAKQRLAVILESLTGQRPVSEASRLLGISVRHFHCLRQQWLQEAIQGLEPRATGRPNQLIDAGDARMVALEAERQRLQIDLRAAQLREEIALTMPHLLQRKRLQKKTRPHPSERASRPAKPAMSPGSKPSARPAKS